MAKVGLPKGSGKRLKVREKSVKSQGILKRILSGNPVKNRLFNFHATSTIPTVTQIALQSDIVIRDTYLTICRWAAFYTGHIII